MIDNMFMRFVLNLVQKLAGIRDMSTLISVLDFNAVFIFSLPELLKPVDKYKHQTVSY